MVISSSLDGLVFEITSAIKHSYTRNSQSSSNQLTTCHTHVVTILAEYTPCSPKFGILKHLRDLNKHLISSEIQLQIMYITVIISLCLTFGTEWIL